MAAELLVEDRGPLRLLTLSNPEHRNALGREMYEPLRDALAGAGDAPRVRAVVLAGAGGVFSAGGNLHRLREVRGRPPAEQAASLDALHEAVRALAACAVPVIAAVEGAAAGAALSLVLGCDLVVAGAGAKFAMSHVRVALSADGGGSWQAVRRLPWQCAAELLLEGKPWPAARLQALGVVNEIVPDGSVLDAALARAASIAELSGPAVRDAKRLLREAATAPLAQQLDAEKASFLARLYHAHAGEAIDAFFEKRAPSFR